jgi:hypothetical protein
MENNSLKAPTLFSTGFLPDTSKMRIKQGLLPQQISNQCFDSNNSNETCDDKNIYPFPSSQLSYGKHSSPLKCSCSRFLYKT